MIKKLLNFLLVSITLLTTGNTFARAISLRTSISPEGSGTVMQNIISENGDEDRTSIKKSYAMDVENTDKISLYPTANDGYVFKKFIINGKDLNISTLENKPLSEIATNGEIVIEVVFEKNNSNPQPPTPAKREIDFTVKIKPDNVCTAQFSVGDDGDYIDIENNSYSGKIPSDESLNLFASINEDFENDYEFGHFLINGKIYDTQGSTFFMQLPIQDYVSNGRMDVEIIFSKKDNGNGNEPNNNGKKSVLNINIYPQNSCKLRYGFGYDDRGTVTNENIDSKDIPQEVIDGDNVLVLNATEKDGFEFVQYKVNGKEFKSKSMVFVPIKENIIDGILKIDVVCRAKNGNNNNNNVNDKGWYPAWGQSINTSKIEREPKSDIISDNEGNIYKIVSVAADCDVEENNTVSVSAPSALIIKYNSLGKVQWTRKISGEGHIVKGYGIALMGNSIFVCGSYDNVKNSQNIFAEKGAKGISENEISANTKTDDDLFLASYDLDGNLQNIKTITSSSSRIEIPKDIVFAKNSLYISGYSEGGGDNLSYNNISVDVAANQTFAFVFEVNPKTLELNKLYKIKASDYDDISISSLAYSEKERLFFTGSTNTATLFYNQNKSIDIKASPNALIFGELDLESDKIKDIKILSKEDASIQGYCIATNSNNDVYIGGNADADVVLNLNDGTKSEELNGNFIIKWDINEQNPQNAFAIGTNDSDNVITSIALSDNERVFFAGDYNGAITINDNKSIEFGEGDSFFGSINPENHKIDMFTTYGSSGMESATMLHLNKNTRKLYLSGYYGGQAFSLYGVRNTQNTGLGQYNYYFSVFDLSEIIPTHLDSLNTIERNIKVFGNRIMITHAGEFTIYNLMGEIVKRGFSDGNTSIMLDNGIYIVRSGYSVQKVILGIKQ